MLAQQQQQLVGTITQALNPANPEQQRAANAWLVASLEQMPFEAILPVAFTLPTQQQQAAFFAQNMLNRCCLCIIKLT